MTDDSHDPAAGRFAIISIVRLLGAAMAFVALLILGGAIDAPYFLGIVLLVLGLADFALAPRFLASQWKSPPEDR